MQVYSVYFFLLPIKDSNSSNTLNFQTIADVKLPVKSHEIL
jgi:hypothetical protein